MFKLAKSLKNYVVQYSVILDGNNIYYKDLENSNLNKLNLKLDITEILNKKIYTIENFNNYIIDEFLCLVNKETFETIYILNNFESIGKLSLVFIIDDERLLLKQVDDKLNKVDFFLFNFPNQQLVNLNINGNPRLAFKDNLICYNELCQTQ
jgi:hypothetical protein